MGFKILGVIIILLLITVLVLAGILLFYPTSNSYRLGSKNQVYRVGSSTHQLSRSGKFLKEEALLQQKLLLSSVSRFLTEQKIEYWCAEELQNYLQTYSTLPPFSTRLTLYARWKDRFTLFSRDFKDLAAAQKLDIVTLKNVSADYAPRYMNMLRFYHQDTGSILVVHVYLVRQVIIQKIPYLVKVDSWQGKKFEYTEDNLIRKDDIFPLVTTKITDLVLTLPKSRAHRNNRAQDDYVGQVLSVITFLRN